MSAILAMDSYNRKRPSSDTTVGIEIEGTALGFWNLGDRKDESDEHFFAQAYSYGGRIVISYRGTDNPWDIPDWATGGGDYWTDQTILAAQFYRTIAANNPASQITLTGHSMGGGLAGFVGSIYGVSGVLFDYMPYELAASRLYYNATPRFHPELGMYMVIDPVARQEFYGNTEPPPVSNSQLSGYAVDGEILDYLRYSGMTPTELESPWGGPIDRHSQSLLVILLYADQMDDAGGDADSKWANLGAYLIASLFSVEVAQAAGANSFQGTSSVDERCAP